MAVFKCKTGCFIGVVCFICLLWVDSTPALEPEANAVFVRVIDVGAGLCCVVKMPGDRYMIYDAGNYRDRGALTFSKISQIIPEGATIEFLVLSHSDADHLGAVDEICDAYKVRKVIESGYQRTTSTWSEAETAIGLEREIDECLDINLRFFEFPPGATYRFGESFVTMVFGLHRPPPEWDALGLSDSEEKNAGSIVIRIQYKGKSILFTGDFVGRKINDPVNVCIAAEKEMVDNSPVINIDSDVIIAPHHGADNGSSTDFIKKVSPEYVIFSAGHDYEHPRASTAKRYLDNGVQLSKMFRTDRGDDEGSSEWNHLRQAGNHDSAGDDDVDILIREDGSLIVEYRNP